MKRWFPSKKNAVAKGVNPLKADPKLKELLEQSKTLSSKEEFDEWKKSFLRRVDDIVENDGKSVENAFQSYARVQAEVDHFARKVLNLQQCIKNDNLNKTVKTVRGQRALGEIKDGATKVMMTLIEWMPGTRKDEQKLGYSKWQLGAVLVRNGFELYETMVSF